ALGAGNRRLAGADGALPVSRRRRLLLDLTKQAKFCNSKKWGKRISTIAARRGGAPILPVSENDAIFAI
ncbi:MAG: hypothetical protein EBU46_19055, partial [Nitrosomonadaceae bacterium]|nr:hypothetical protein [Nitrosomonadaceae bacterium]